MRWVWSLGPKPVDQKSKNDRVEILPQNTEGCMGEQAPLEFDLSFGDVLLHKLGQAF